MTVLQVNPLPEETGPAWLSLMNSGLRDCPGFEPLVDLVAAMEDRLVGGTTARIDQEYNQAKSVALGSLNPGGVGVLPAYRRRRIGSRLLAEALALFRGRGMHQATVWTFSYLESETPDVVLYQRAGATVARRSLGWERAL